MSKQQKDMRDLDLAVPYVAPEKGKDEQDISGTLATTMPMIAIFTRNKWIAWTAVLFAVQAYLAETPEQRKKASTPAYFTVALAVLSLGTTYLPLFLPTPAGRGGVPGVGTGTGAQPPIAPAGNV